MLRARCSNLSPAMGEGKSQLNKGNRQTHRQTHKTHAVFVPACSYISDPSDRSPQFPDPFVSVAAACGLLPVRASQSRAHDCCHSPGARCGCCDEGRVKVGYGGSCSSWHYSPGGHETEVGRCGQIVQGDYDEDQRGNESNHQLFGLVERLPLRHTQIGWLIGASM